MFGLYDKAEIHLLLNRFHGTAGDQLFPYITWLGDGIMVVLAVLLLLFVKYRFAILLAAANLLAAGITQLLKHTLFADVVRPKEYFKNILDIHYVEGVENYLYNSFPSGHTTAAFATFFCFALMAENKLAKLVFFLFAMTTGFSRIYLSQHFLQDVYAGSLIGVSISALVYTLMAQNKKLNAASWPERSLLKHTSK